MAEGSPFDDQVINEAVSNHETIRRILNVEPGSQLDRDAAHYASKSALVAQAMRLWPLGVDINPVPMMTAESAESLALAEEITTKRSPQDNDTQL